MKRIALVTIDPQNDFCNPATGTLYVGDAAAKTGAYQDCQRLAKLIDRLGDKIHDIHVTLDSHHVFDIAHPSFHKDQHGNKPNPFTLITHDDVQNGKWMAAVPSLQKDLLAYTLALKNNGRYVLCVWPEHCLIGSPGAAIQEDVLKSLIAWEHKRTGRMVNKITKGSNFKTEHYSAIIADVPDPNDPSTGLNMGFITMMQSVDEIWVSGQALSHCVANTFRDLANNFGEDNIKKLVLLEDCCSNVPGFESMGQDFIKEMTKRGMRVHKSTDV